MTTSPQNFPKCIALCVLGYQVMGLWAYSPKYELIDVYDGSNFLSQFRFFTDSDPTSGYVQYVGSNAAQTSGLAQVTNDNQVYIGADNSTIIDNSSNATTTGRKSVRLESLGVFDQGVLIADFAHVPSSICGTWPAYWTYNYAEDPYGEVDILEGDNNQIGDVISLHTSAQCKLKDNASRQTGTDVRADCSLKTNYLDGCGVSGPPNSYGDSFNDQGGGVWALLLAQDDLAIWMFPRDDIPSDITAGEQLTLQNWSTPMLHFTSDTGCRVSEQWKNQTIIFDIDFCGENAGGTNWNESSTSTSQSCADSTGFSSCEAYVAANPGAFSDSYFLINSVKLYQSNETMLNGEALARGAASMSIPRNHIASLLMMGWLLVAGW